MSSSEPHIVGEDAAQTHFPGAIGEGRGRRGGDDHTARRGCSRLVPVEPGGTSQEHRAAIDSIKALGRGISLGELTIRDLIQEGRR